MRRGYPAVFYHQGDGSIGAVFPDLPGCATVGSDVRDAVVRAAEALALHLDGMEVDGDGLPEPTTPVEAAAVDAEASGDVIGKLLIVAQRTRAVRVNITLEEGLLARIDRAAEEVGMTRSGFLAAGARQLMAERDAT